MAATKRKPRTVATKNKELQNNSISNDPNLLTFDHLLQESEKYDELIRVEFDDGRYTEIYARFSNVKIDKMLEDFSNFVSDFNKNIGELGDKKTLDYLNLFIFIYFSKVTDKLDYTFNQKVDVFDKILKTDLAEKIFDAFDKKEVAKVYDRMYKKLDQYLEVVKTNRKMKSDMLKYIEESDLQNKDLLKSVMFTEDGSGDVVGDEFKDGVDENA